MNCCTNETSSPRSMVSVGHFDFDYRYNYNESPEQDVENIENDNNEEQRQEEQMLDALNIVERDQSRREVKKQPMSAPGEIVVETVGVLSVDSSVSASKATACTQGSTAYGSQKSVRQCHGFETTTDHARINFFKSPSHLKEDVEMEFRVPSTVSHRTGSYHTGTEASSLGTLSATSGEEMDQESDSSFHVEDLNHAIEMLREGREQLRATKKQWKATQQELRNSKKEATEIREKAQIVKRELKNFNQEWESQQTLLRNKDKELERLRMIIADRTHQLTEKTGELSITKVALVSSENGLSACRNQVISRTEELEKVKEELEELRKALSDSKAELGRTKLQLESSAERRRQFSSKAMRLLLLGESESMEPENANKVSEAAAESNQETAQTIHNPKAVPVRAKSWSFGASASINGEAPDADADQDAVPDDADATDDCPVPFSFSSPATSTRKTKEIGIQASSSGDESATSRGRDRAILRPTRSRSKSCDVSSSFKQDSNGTNQKSLDETAAENAANNCDHSLYFDSASKASTMDAIKTNPADSVAAETEAFNSDYFDSASKTPSASGSNHKLAFPETSQKEHGTCTEDFMDASDFDTACQSENESLLEQSRSIEFTSSAVSHLTDPTIAGGASEASFMSSAVTLLKSHPKQPENDSMVQQKGKKWKAMLKHIKSKNGEEEEGELMSATGSTFDDVSSCNSHHAVVVRKNRNAVGVLATMLVVGSASAFMAKGRTGVSYMGGVLNVSDSGLIVACASLVMMLALQSLWNMLKQGWVLMHNVISS